MAIGCATQSVGWRRTPTHKKGIELFGAFPDLGVWIADTNLSHSITLDLDFELKALPVVFHPRRVAVILSFHVLVAIECISPTEMLRDQSSGVGVRQGPVRSSAKLECSARLGSFHYLAGPANMNPSSNHVFGELRGNRGSSGLVIRTRLSAGYEKCEREEGNDRRNLYLPDIGFVHGELFL